MGILVIIINQSILCHLNITVSHYSRHLLLIKNTGFLLGAEALLTKIGQLSLLMEWVSQWFKAFRHAYIEQCPKNWFSFHLYMSSGDQSPVTRFVWQMTNAFPYKVICLMWLLCPAADKFYQPGRSHQQVHGAHQGEREQGEACLLLWRR